MRRLSLAAALLLSAAALGQGKKPPPFPPKPGDSREFKGHDGKVTGVGVSPDGKAVVSCGSDGTVRVWAATTGKGEVVHGFAKPFGPLYTVSLANPPAKGKPAPGTAVGVVSFSRGEVWVADLQAGRGLLRLGEDYICCGMSPDGRVAAGSYHADPSLHLQPTAGGPVAKVPLRFPAHAVAFTADSVVVDVERLGMQAYALKDGKPGVKYKGGPDHVRGLAVAGKKLFAGGTSDDVSVWEVATGKELPPLPGHGGGVNGLHASASGKRVVAACGDGLARVWDASTGKLVAELKGHEGAVLAAAIAPGDKWAATAGTDGSVRVHGLPD